MCKHSFPLTSNALPPVLTLLYVCIAFRTLKQAFLCPYSSYGYMFVYLYGFKLQPFVPSLLKAMGTEEGNVKAICCKKWEMRDLILPVFLFSFALFPPCTGYCEEGIVARGEEMDVKWISPMNTRGLAISDNTFHSFGHYSTSYSLICI